MHAAFFFLLSNLSNTSKPYEIEDISLDCSNAIKVVTEILPNRKILFNLPLGCHDPHDPSIVSATVPDTVVDLSFSHGKTKINNSRYFYYEIELELFCKTNLK